MDNPAEHALVLKAITSGLGNCILWKRGALERVCSDPELAGLTPAGIKQHLVEYVKSGGNVRQLGERREGHKDLYDFYYKAILPIDGFVRGLFVEMALSNDDSDCPVVVLVSVHSQPS